VAVIGGFRSDLSITRKTDFNFENVSASVLLSTKNVEETSVECENQKRCKPMSKFLLAFSRHKAALQQKYPGLQSLYHLCQIIHFHHSKQLEDHGFSKSCGQYCHDIFPVKDTDNSLFLFSLLKY